MRPHELVATTPPDRLVAELVRNLAETIDGHAAYRVPRGSGLVTAAAWPDTGEAGQETARVPVTGGGVLVVARPARFAEPERLVLAETAGWLGVVSGVDRLRAEHERAGSRALALRAEVTAARKRLATVRDLERRRLVRAITATTLRDLDDIRGRLRDLDTTAPARSGLVDASGAMDELIENFRTVVRGVYPAMLPDRGPRAALEELAATLPHPVRFTGDLGRRAGWQLESGLYHSVAAVLNLLAGKDTVTDEPVAVDFGRDETMRVRIAAPGGSWSTEELRAALSQDRERLAALGGTLDGTVADGSALLTVRLGDRIDPAEIPPGAPRYPEHPLYQRVWELVRQGQDAAGESGDGAGWDAVAERLGLPPRVAVVTDGEPDAAPEIPEITVVATAGPADKSLAQEFLADNGSLGSVDAVLCLVPPAPAFAAALRWGRQRVELTESATLATVAARLTAWSPVIAARRALVAVRELLAGLPDSDPLRWAADRITAEAHEIAELDLLDDLERGGTGLPPEPRAEAVLLLGVQGTDAPTRLGLPSDASGDQVRVAAAAAVRRWRTRAGHPVTGGRDRAACEVLARTAEGLLSTARTR